MSLIEVTEKGFYCERGGFHIDSWGKVDVALITHGHADHARRGAARYLAAKPSEAFLHDRLGKDAVIKAVDFGKPVKLGSSWVSFHPAGHVLGSAQIRIEYGGEVWVVSGDYKRANDPTCTPFEVVPCDCFITEATFGLPIYSWEEGAVVASQILEWWQSAGDRTSILFCYAFGKTQRVIAELALLTDRGVFLHDAACGITKLYRERGIPMLPFTPVSSADSSYSFRDDLVIAPPSAFRSSWMERFSNPRTAFASGWMQVRGERRRRGFDRGFVLSDHADWDSLIHTIRECGAKQLQVSHGYADTLARYAREEMGIDARPLMTRYEGKGDIG